MQGSRSRFVFPAVKGEVVAILVIILLVGGFHLVQGNSTFHSVRGWIAYGGRPPVTQPVAAPAPAVNAESNPTQVVRAFENGPRLVLIKANGRAIAKWVRNEYGKWEQVGDTLIIRWETSNLGTWEVYPGEMKGEVVIDYRSSSAQETWEEVNSATVQ